MEVGPRSQRPMRIGSDEARGQPFAAGNIDPGAHCHELSLGSLEALRLACILSGLRKRPDLFLGRLLCVRIVFVLMYEAAPACALKGVLDLVVAGRPAQVMHNQSRKR